MARQKLVFANADELVHIWASQVQDEGRSSNMCFRSGHIYSYAMMIASFRANAIVFLNSRRRSSNTSGHQKAVRSAASTSTVFEYNCIPHWCGDEVATLHEDPSHIAPIDIWEQYRDIWFNLLASAFQKRFKRTASQRLAVANEYAKKANSIAMLFTLDCYTLSVDIDADIAEHIEAENARKERKRIAEFEQCIQERMDWLEGKGCSYYYPNRYENDIVLRVFPDDDDMVETSRGALVPLRVCARLYRAFKTTTMPHDREVGSYQLNSVSVEGLTIGCHFIKAEELERFAKVLGLGCSCLLNYWVAPSPKTE